MQQVGYALIRTVGQYGDRWPVTLLISTSRELLERVMADEKAACRMREDNHNLMSDFRQFLETMLPRPDAPWPPPESKDLSDAWMLRYSTWSEAHESAIRDYAALHGWMPDDYAYESTCTYFDLEEVPMLMADVEPTIDKLVQLYDEGIETEDFRREVGERETAGASTSARQRFREALKTALQRS